MKTERSQITFSSGRTAYANSCVVGINETLEIHQGWDGHICWRRDFDVFNTAETLTSDDMAELADHMIGLWTKFKETLK